MLLHFLSVEPFEISFFIQLGMAPRNKKMYKPIAISLINELTSELTFS
jgi:hypothetical protein